MGLVDRVGAWLTGFGPDLQQRTEEDEEPELSDFVGRIQALRATQTRPWRPASTREALGIPTVFAAVTLITNIAGSLTLRAFRNGELLPDGDRPILTVRPNPLSTTREFIRDTVYPMAAWGEGWWWVAKRDSDGNAIALWPVPPFEVIVSENPNDPRYPFIDWRGRRMPNRDMIQLVMQKTPGSLRGAGPLQMCGAAISVGVEAQEWAANYFATGGNPNVNLHNPDELDANEALEAREQWVKTPPNMPQVTSGKWELREVPFNAQSAQMMQAREYQNGEFARMFNIPGTLLDHAMPGTSLTYQNVGNEFDKFVRLCLLPNYLEPMEQALSDLLTRSTVTRFNTEALLRADAKTRWEIYESAITVLGPEEGAAYARSREGLTGGDIENAPVPLAPPAAAPGRLPYLERAALTDLRCPKCQRLVARYAGGTIEAVCPRCRTAVAA